MLKPTFLLFCSSAVLFATGYSYATFQGTIQDIGYTNSQTKDFELSAQGMDLVEKALGQASKLNQAEQLFNEALKINSKNYEAITGLGRITLKRGYLSGEQYEPEALIMAMQYANKAIALNNKYGKAYYLRGSLFAYMGKYTEALEDAQRLEDLGKDNCNDYMTLRGGTYKLQGAKNKSIDTFLNKLRCPNIDDYDKKQAYKYLGFIYEDMNDYNNALIWLKKSIETLPTAWDYGNYGSVLRKAGRLDEAEAMVLKAINIQDYPMAHIYLSCIYAQKGDRLKEQRIFEAAELEYIKGLKEYSNQRLAYQGLAHLYAITNQCDKLNKLLSTYPNDTYMKGLSCRAK